MKRAVDDVRAFHDACGVPIAKRPVIISAQRSVLRFSLIDEECNLELLPAIVEGDLEKIADACVDLIYVVIGTALEYGIPLNKVWREVHRSNMAKVNPDTGEVIYRDDGKVLKPEGWTPPDIAACLR